MIVLSKIISDIKPILFVTLSINVMFGLLFLLLGISLGDEYNYWDDTVITFGGKDTTGKVFYINRYEGKPLFLKECRDPE